MLHRIAATVIVCVMFNVIADPNIIITELHRDPSAGNKTAIPGGYSHVFVEVTNFSRDTFHLQNVFLTNGKTADSVTLWDAPIPAHDSCVFDAAYIPPGGVAVIFPRNYLAGLAAAPQSLHPVAPGTVMLTVNRANLTGGVANDDGMALYRGTRSRIDSLIDVAADPGVEVTAPTDGKIPLAVPQVKGSSVVPASLLLGGDRMYAVSPKEPLTPGRIDSYQNGIYIEYLTGMVSQTAVRCSVAGIFVTRESAGASWRMYSETSGGTITDINSGTFDPSNARFLLTVDISLEPRRYFFEIAADNVPVITIPIDLSAFWADAGTLRVTELYPRGSASADQPEWFEIHNPSAAEVNLKGWMFGASSGDTAVIAASDYVLPAGEFIVVCRDTAAMRNKYRALRRLVRPARWFALNNTGDTVTLWSPRGIQVDKNAYRNAWFKGWTTQSLERVGENGIDSTSWVLCDRPTPGGPGQASQWRGVELPSIDIGPTPFSPNGDGKDDLLSIRVKAPANYRVKIRVFAFNGKLLKTFTDEKEILYWNGMNDRNRPAAPGPIYVIGEFTSGGTRKVVRRNGVLWR